MLAGSVPTHLYAPMTVQKRQQQSRFIGSLRLGILPVRQILEPSKGRSWQKFGNRRIILLGGRRVQQPAIAESIQGAFTANVSSNEELTWFDG